MEDDDESLNTFLAYTKSPKTSKRTSFQDELKKAVNARVSRQQAVEDSENSDYSEEFESDDSLNESLGKTKTIESKVHKPLHDFHFSEEEDSHGKLSFIKNKKQTDRNIHKEPDHSVITDNINKADYKHGLPKSPLFGEDKEKPPTPKPRESKMKHAPSPPGIGASLSEESFKPTPQHRNLPRKSSHLEDKEEGKHSSDKVASLSAPSSLTRLSDKVPVSEIQSFSERSSPEGYWLSKPPSPSSKFKSLSITGHENSTTIPKEPASMALKDLDMGEVDGHGSPEPHGSGRKSPSVFEMMMVDVKEKSIKQEKKDPIHMENHEIRSSSDQYIWDNDGRLKHGQQQLDHQKNSEVSSELGQSKSNRSISALHTNKRSPKPKTQMSPKPRYLGTLTILDKSVNDNNCDVEAADSLRAAVYQNWLGKKKVFLHELHQIKKSQVEQEKEKTKMETTMKKEEAMAAFRAWKTEKKKEIKENQMKQKMEQKKKMDEFQEIARKQEDCRKAFEKWKESKEEYLREKALKEKLTEMEKKRMEDTTVKEKNNVNMSAFKTWNERKEHVLNQKKKQEKYEKLKLEKIKAEKEDKEKRALEVYEQWLMRKERQEVKEKKQKKLQVILDDDPPPPWSPPGKTIPAGR
ncbi:microtubule-associated protein 9 [Mixophyes fleayi]|uniref:microtubule-associated protein 9 n=1 Tax=Mixophyes fleayi TaxID=3061075 RepID=UPI003F4D8D8B